MSFGESKGRTGKKKRVDKLYGFGTARKNCGGNHKKRVGDRKPRKAEASHDIGEMKANDNCEHESSSLPPTSDIKNPLISNPLKLMRTRVLS
ncbi:hypothetical protein RUM43_007023 [Polyplax serrata]|uniref:Uncharacterized protein n=1 Tax=Polyplax serrata TaxID=468196 RepID=A0AAN8P4Y7_POLSC